MPSKLKRLSLAIPPEVESDLKALKKEVFFNKSKSEMIRELLVAGIEVSRPHKEMASNKGND